MNIPIMSPLNIALGMISGTLCTMSIDCIVINKILSDFGWKLLYSLNVIT